MTKSPLWVGPAKRQAMRWGECGKVIGNTQKRLACFCSISCFPAERAEASFCLDFWALSDQAKSAGEQCDWMYIRLLTSSAVP
jgi:hypothetical protein